MILSRNAVRFILLLTISFNIFSFELDTEYQKAKQLFEDQMYSMAEIAINRVTNNYPTFEEAWVLGYKILYKQAKDIDPARYLELSKESKEEILSFLLDREDIKNADVFIATIEQNPEIKKIYLDILFDKKDYRKIAENFQDEIIYLNKIEEKKYQSENNYFEAINSLRDGKVEKAFELLNLAIDRYPFNYKYHLKIGQLYADKRNYYLAENSFKKALKYSQNSEIYLNLFKLYDKTNQIDKLYSVADKIINDADIRKRLRELYIEDELSKQKVQILKREDNFVYIRAKLLPDANIGDAYYIGIINETIRDLTTGEELSSMREKYAKARVYHLRDDVIILYLIEEYKNINEFKVYNIF